LVDLPQPYLPDDTPARDSLPQRVEAVRRFNRFYTEQISLLHEELLLSPFSLTEARVLYELAHREKPTATELAKELGLDVGYLSRILRGFKKRGLIKKKLSDSDARQSFLSLSERGNEAFGALNTRAAAEIARLLSELPIIGQNRLIEAMHAIEELLGGKPERTSYLLRPHQPGDMGWIVHRHGVLYAQEYGWDEQFEALVAGIVAEFIQRYDPQRERCWIAEQDGDIVGSVFVVNQSMKVARLRLLLVEPRARGQGLGGRLVSECLKFARQVGYRKVTLWTSSALRAARHLYESAGFRLVHQEPHHSFGHDLIAETWDLTL
jgi:DNA-binding MarR family transcriptional regulator/N-acetylglutamate synthase-like GNAT family acetyltransferase